MVHARYLTAGGGASACRAQHDTGLGSHSRSRRVRDWPALPLQAGAAQQVTAGKAVHGQRRRGVQREGCGTRRTLLLIWEHGNNADVLWG